MERLTLDEAIAHAKEVAEEKYNEGFLCHANPDDGKLDKCVKCAQEHEQLAEWLTQLKEYQQLEKQGRLALGKTGMQENTTGKQNMKANTCT